MSKRLKDGVYKTTVGGDSMRYFVHDGLIVMSSKYGTFKTTEHFMLGMQYSVNPEPLPDGMADKFLEEYNKLEQW
jgi:hypothetical protein